jgi:hypothetical protein
MRKLPTYLVALFLLITLTRVAQFAGSTMQAGWMGWPFSIGLGVAVYASAYNLRVHLLRADGTEDPRSRAVRQVALPLLILFVLADGAFNLWDVLLAVRAPELQVAAWVYGLFPTLAAAALGLLQGTLDKLPVPPVRYNISVALRAWIAHQLRIPAQDASHDARIEVHHAEPAKLPAASYACNAPGCSETFPNIQARAAHMRWDHKRKVAADLTLDK